MSEEVNEAVQVVDTGRVITDRSDIDTDLAVGAKQLGEDWGDGFFVEAEPVVVDRGPDGEIVRTTPLSERMLQLEQYMEQQAAEPEEAAPVISPTPLNREQRDKLVFILAKRLFDYYRDLGPHLQKYNPVYDGIPDYPAGAQAGLVPRPGTDLYDATPLQVFEWLKGWIAKRIEITNKRQGWEGYRPSIKFKVD